jgi:FixJ family two-component response regulator
VITDFEMPGGNGDLLVNHLEDSSFQGKIIVHTSCDLSEMVSIRLYLEKSKNALFLQKPTRFKEFSNALQNFCRSDFMVHRYRRVRIPYFYRFNKALCDIYVKINEYRHGKHDIFDIIFKKI